MSDAWKPVRTRRGSVIHLTHDLRFTACNRPCDGWVYAADQAVTCIRCFKETTTN